MRDYTVTVTQDGEGSKELKISEFPTDWLHMFYHDLKTKNYKHGVSSTGQCTYVDMLDRVELEIFIRENDLR